MPVQSELIRVVQRLSSCRDLDGVMAVLRDHTRQLTGADGITVVLLDGDMCHYVEEDAIGPLWKGRRFPLETCISGWCMIHRQQIVVPDIYQDSRVPHDAYRPTFVRSLAMTPIRSDDPIGAIGAYWARHHEASPEELEILQALGDSAALAIANAQTIQALRDSSQRKDELLAMLAHELRNPLGPIRNALHVLHLHAGGESEVAGRAREMMERQVQLLARIVDDLLDIARINHGQVALQRERLDLARIVRQSVEDRMQALESRGLVLDLELPETPVWISGDAMRLSQVLGNLLENAGKFTPTGGRIAVWLTTQDSPRKALLTLRDTGVGIAPEVLPHIFDVFTQGHQSLDRAQGGLGLGLSVVRRLLELHGGTIQAASEGLDQGAVFTCELPWDAEPPALVEGVTLATAAVQPRRILVVEDNLDAAESLRILLELFGYGVTLAHTGPDGVAAAQATRPDVVLCDIGLPGMDGFTVANTLRKIPETAAVRLIAVTGYGEEEDRRRALAAGFDLHLVKPVDPQKLLGYLV